MDEFKVNSKNKNENVLPLDKYVTQNDMTTKAKKGIIAEHYQMKASSLYKDDGDMQASAFKNAYTSYAEEYQALMSNKRVLYDDTETMQKVKEALLHLNQSFWEKIPDDNDQFEVALDKMKSKYSDVIEKCDKYIDAHPGDRSFFGKGRIRKRMVTNLKTRAESESKKLDSRARFLVKQAKGSNVRPTWINVLAEVRTKTLILDKNDNSNPNYTIDSVGKSSSTVFRINDGINTFYIKDMETNQSNENKCQYLLDSETLKDKDNAHYTKDQTNILKALKEILVLEKKDSVNYNLLEKLYFYKSQDEYRNISLSDFFTSDEGPEIFQRIVSDFTPQMFNVLNKYSMTKNTLLDNSEFSRKCLTQIFINNSLQVNCRQSKISLGANLSKRNVATSRMAKLLKIENLVAPSEIVRYKKNGQLREGILMQEAKGRSYEVISSEYDRRYMITGTLKTMIDFNTIELFDAICGQTDRNGGNFIVKEENWYVTSPVCIDNDFSFGKLKYKDIANKCVHLSLPFEAESGLCRLEFLDAKVVNTLEELMKNEETIRYELIDLLSKEELDCLIDRMRGIVKSIERTKKENTEFLVDRENPQKDLLKARARQSQHRDKKGNTYYDLLEDKMTFIIEAKS